jgi:hypothetical protein
VPVLAEDGLHLPLVEISAEQIGEDGADARAGEQPRVEPRNGALGGESQLLWGEVARSGLTHAEDHTVVSAVDRSGPTGGRDAYLYRRGGAGAAGARAADG